MGVPAFFGWLIKRYPLVLQKLIEGSGPIIDCLYLDMNGILYKSIKEDRTLFKDFLKSRNYA